MGHSAKYCLDIKKLAHVKGCAADLDEFMLYRNDSDWIGMSAADVELLDLNPLGSAAEAIARFKADKRSVVVGYEAMRRYGWHIGQQVMLRNTWNGHPVSMPFIIQAVVPDETYPATSLLVEADDERMKLPCMSAVVLDATNPADSVVFVVEGDPADTIVGK